MNGETYYQPTKPNINNYNLAVDPHGLNQTEYLENLKKYRKEIKQTEADRA
jgi:hypothetical protein